MNKRTETICEIMKVIFKDEIELSPNPHIDNILEFIEDIYQYVDLPEEANRLNEISSILGDFSFNENFTPTSNFVHAQRLAKTLKDYNMTIYVNPDINYSCVDIGSKVGNISYISKICSNIIWEDHPGYIYTIVFCLTKLKLLREYFLRKKIEGYNHV